MASSLAIKFPHGSNPVEMDQARLEALESYGGHDTGPDPGLDRIARLVRNIFEVPIATVSMIDGHRQILKGAQGIAHQAVPLKDTFCRHALYSEMLVVPDAMKDVRFKDNRFVTGDAHIRFYAGTPLTTVEGQPIGTLCALDTEARDFTARERTILSDLAQVAMDEIELRYRATTDPLTNVLSRRGFYEAAQKAVAHAVRHRQPLGCIVLDVDHFKAVNDMFGHASGDIVLRAVADACSNTLRQEDIIGRIGGEEFAILLPMTGQSPAAILAERLRTAIRGTEIMIEGRSHAVTASFGVTALGRSPETLEALVAQADGALYEAKSAGRNRVAEWGKNAGPAAARWRVLRAGRMVFKDGRPAVDCTVRFLAANAAGLDVTDAQALPDCFTLEIPSERLKRECRIVTRAHDHVEVAFSQD